MATQGMVTVRKNGNVVMKIVTGCDGQKAPEMAQYVRKMWPMRIQQVYDTALSMGFGITENLVVISRNKVRFADYSDRDEFCRESPLYATTFNDPMFNPRWHYGTAEFTEIIDL